MQTALLLAFAVAACGFYPLLGAAARPLLLAVAAAMAAVLAASVAAHARRDRVPLALLAAAQGFWCIGWTAWGATLLAGGSVGTGSIVFTLFLPSYPLFAGTAMGMMRRRERNEGGSVDTLVIAVALFAVAWFFLLHRYFAAGSVGGVMAHLNAVGYGVGDIIVVAASMRLLLSRGSRSVAHWALISAGSAAVASDAIWNWSTAFGSYTFGSWADEGWLLFSVLAALAAFRAPGETRAPAAPTASGDRFRFARLVLVAATATGTPLLIAFAEGGETKFPIAATSSLLIVLILVWLRSVLARQSVLLDELQLKNDALAEAATTDSVTGLANRGLLIDRLAQSLARRERGYVMVIFLDLDDFKLINDSYGHHVGDDVLRAVSGRLCRVVRAGDTVARVESRWRTESSLVARLGGDEFVVVAAELEDAAAAGEIAARLEESLLAPIKVGDEAIDVRASIGVAVAAPDDDRDAEALLRDGDTAMYVAKRSGKSNSRLFAPEMHTTVVNRLELVRDIRQAIDNDELCLLYQPIVDLETRRVEAVEALVRWNHPTRGLLAPDTFIPVAESHGLIGALDAWVARSTCAQARAWRQDGHELRVAFNVSAFTIADPGFVDILKQCIQLHDVDPQSLEIEITETAALIHAAEAERPLHRLRALGVQLAIDDFGVGHSSLSRLHTFPISRLKIDRAFVAPLTSGTASDSIVAAMIAMAHSLGLETVAEGVESPGQEAALRLLGCNSAQGFLFARPLPASNLDRFLHAPADELKDREQPRPLRRKRWSRDNYVRHLLAELQRLTGLESTYVTEIDIPAGVQRIVTARNSGTLEIPEEAVIPWSETVCRRAIEQGTPATNDVPTTFASSRAAQQLGLQTYVGVPIYDGHGDLVGTLCAASSSRVDISPATIDVMQQFATLITTPRAA